MLQELLKSLEDQVSLWPGVSVREHRFGGREFSVGRLEVGHTHGDGFVDIPFPPRLRDQVLLEGMAQKHRWAPESGWATLQVRCNEDVQRALRLLRLSYLCYVLKAVPEPRKRFDAESKALALSPRLRNLLYDFVPCGCETAAA